MISPTISEDAFLQIPEDERSAVLSIGIAMRLAQLRERLFLARAKVNELEEKYSKTLDQLESEGLAEDASPEIHEDFILWHHWAERVQETSTKIITLERLGL